ncbi:DUF6492 family protein [Fulvimarina sp. 2208YS6-2-32]|uniref:DUF6492 family protein n=1 Tax=Fulvimarina uroteuthidis TaxID=3098149 RepID=A0ABU5HXX9_9HYPH|nr:DUF6492 family protein [Fulvimarina sp. 2208YS6-2-32]MDY8107947.1 DUF6492 family protein [Fulvimarina sp. 2208YS6-2-32]
MTQVIVTSSYRGDLERCRLLCDSIDARVTGHSKHIIAVEPRDLALFKTLAGSRREIVDERDLFPWWLRAFPDPMRLGKRRVWLSPKGPPLHGWHTQQLRRLVLGTKLTETAMVTVDSDVVFLKPVDTSIFQNEAGKVYFYRKPGGVREALRQYQDVHYAWSRKAGELLGLADPAPSDTGYIFNLVTWATESVRAMNARIEATTGRSAFTALAGTRCISECTIFGRYVDEVEGIGMRHVETNSPFAATYWDHATLDETSLTGFVEAMKPHELALGVQSFSGTDTALIRRVAGLTG